MDVIIFLYITNISFGNFVFLELQGINGDLVILYLFDRGNNENKNFNLWNILNTPEMD